MLQIAFLRDKKDEALQRLAIKNFNEISLIDTAIELDDQRKKTQTELDNLLSGQNSIAKQIGDLFKSGKAAEANDLKNKSAALKESSKHLNAELERIEKELQEILVKIPNAPSTNVPKGKTPAENEEVYRNKISIPELENTSLPHWELAAKYDLIDFELGNKITGAGFPVYKGKGARLQRALINYFLDKAAANGYREIQPPILVNEASGFGTGQLPDKEGQMYFVNEDGLYLIPTAEVPITNLYRDAIVPEENLPIKNAGYTPCFRREAGSWGAHVRGLNRLINLIK